MGRGGAVPADLVKRTSFCGYTVRSEPDAAFTNEVLLKLLCHNIMVAHQAVAEFGIEMVFRLSSGELRDALSPDGQVGVGFR